ncbi:MAG: DNA polymerase IV [Saprospiraceae bacterium]|uniref:DNA polymerase IV n=1 Tax=Candidatus Opimibacter skivensis TaxID=2982028 RepID=A0A9D7SSR7_9BACT|nr:DNA polymerase IV [Candidatus Opimibacter skivensis]
MYDRAILHLDLDSFFVSVECLRDSSLKGKPLIIGGMGGRGVVASCSYEARRYGVHSAMPMKMALRLCPQALVLRGDMDSYTRHSMLVSEIIEGQAPVYEKSSIDEFYLDLTGMDRYFGCYKWSAELRQRIIKESGLPISCALSVNKLVSKVGTGEVKPNGIREIPTGEEREFLAPLSTGKIPGIGKETYKKLSFMGVRTIRVLREIPHPLLEREFGKMGQFLWESSNAIDRRQVIPYNEQKSMSKERTFSEDTLDMKFIRSLLGSMVDELAFDLRQDSRLTSCITVKIRYADFNTFTKQRRIPYTAQTRQLITYAQELFEEVYERRQLIRLIGVKFSGLVNGHIQLNLFDDTQSEISLLQQLDHIRRRWGKDAISWANFKPQARKA